MGYSFMKLKAARRHGAAPPPAPPVCTVAPLIATSVTVGQTVTIGGNEWTNATNLEFQWYAGGVAILGATASTYTAQIADVGKALQVIVTGTGPGGTAQAPSNSSGLVQPATSPNATDWGAKTRRGHGALSLGLFGAVTITSGNTGGVWAVNALNQLVVAGTYGQAPPALLGAYTLTFTAGAESLTLDVTVVPNRFNVRPVPVAYSGVPADSGTTNQINAVVNSGAVNYGDEIVQRDGTTYGINASGSMDDAPTNITVQKLAATNFGVRSGGPSAPTDQGWSSPNYQGSTHLQPGWVKLRADTLLGATIARLEFDCKTKKEQYIQIDGLQGRAYNILRSAGSATACIWIRSDSGTLAWSWFSVINCDVASRMEVGTPSGNSICSALYLKQTFNPSSNYYIYDNYLHDCYNAVIRSGATYELVGNQMQKVYNDVVKGVAFSGLTSWNTCWDKTFIGDAHGDYFQEQWGSVAPGTYVGTTYIGNVMFIGDHGMSGQHGGQGIFIADAKPDVFITGIVIMGNMTCDAISRGINVTRGLNAIVRFNTVVQDLGDTYTPPQVPRIFFGATTGGDASYNVIHSATTSGPVTIDLESPITPPTQTGNYAIRAADHAAAFAAPTYGPGKTPAQIWAAFKSKAGGPLDQAVVRGIGINDNYVDYANRTTSFPAVA